MAEGPFLCVIGLAMVAVLWAGFAVIETGEPHDRCVDARRIELIAGKPARHCPALAWWQEPNGHEAADHE